MAEGSVRYPAHKRVKQKPDDHYKILQHANGEIDLTADEDGRAVLARYKHDADLAAGGPKPPRIPEVGELPPNHLSDEDRDKWLERQRTQALLDGEE